MLNIVGDFIAWSTVAAMVLCSIVCCFFDGKVSTVHPIFNLRDATERTRENGLIPHGLGGVSDRFTGASVGPRNIHGHAKNRARKGHPKKK